MNFIQWLRCHHDRVRCIHGDEIIYSAYRRVRCLDCGRSLGWALPNPCSYTQQPHASQISTRDATPVDG